MENKRKIFTFNIASINRMLSLEATIYLDDKSKTQLDTYYTYNPNRLYKIRLYNADTRSFVSCVFSSQNKYKILKSLKAFTNFISSDKFKNSLTKSVNDGVEYIYVPEETKTLLHNVEYMLFDTKLSLTIEDNVMINEALYSWSVILTIVDKQNKFSTQLTQLDFEELIYQIDNFDINAFSINKLNVIYK